MAVIAGLAALVLTGAAYQAHAQAQPQKKVKDQGEYDLYNNALKETDPAKAVQILNQWVEKYPDTDFQDERLQLYNKFNQPAKVLEQGKAILSKDSKDLTALTLITANIQKIPNATADQLDLAKNSAQSILDNMDSLKPPTATDDAWKQAKPGLESLSKGTIDWIVTKPAREAMDKKDYPGAEAAFKKLVQQYPDNGQYAYQLGSVLISERNQEKYPEAIFYIARALETPGLPAQNRPQVEAYLKKIFDAYHGADDEELQKLRQLAKASPAPPANFKIKTAAEIAAEKEEEFKTKNPQLALWMGIKKQLADANGEQYFESSVKNAAVPKLKGTLLEAKPPCRPKELVLGISDAKNPEITLKLEMPLTNKPDVGKEIQFQGVPSAFTKDPFNLTMDVDDKDKIEGLTGEACAATKAPVKKAAPVKKKE
jgi:tetratricopeptide (TPR) repeat protein